MTDLDLAKARLKQARAAAAQFASTMVPTMHELELLSELNHIADEAESEVARVLAAQSATSGE